MFSRRSPLLKIAVVLALALMSTVFALWFYDGDAASTTVSAQEPADTAVFACVNKSSGEIKIVDSLGDCKKNEDEITWPLVVGGTVQAESGFKAGAASTEYIDGEINLDGTTTVLNIAGGNLYIDDANNRVGIGTVPVARLHVNGSMRVSETGLNARETEYGPGTVTLVGGDLDIDGGTLFIDNSTNRVGIGKTNPATELDVDGAAIVRGKVLITDDLEVGPTPSDRTLFVDVSDKRVGIGTTSPSAKLDVVGTTELNGNLAVVGNIAVSGTGARLPSSISRPLHRSRSSLSWMVGPGPGATWT
jgi:hypothetical protein